MSSITLEIFVILILILGNGVFAMSEIAIVSARKARLQQWANQGNKKARTALDLANSPNRFLSTIQVGITLIGILAGAFGGATLAEKLNTSLTQIPLIAPYSGPLSLLLVVVSIAYLSLIFGELVPKRLGLTYPEKIATLVASPMRMLATIGAPIIHLLSSSTELTIRLLGLEASEEPLVTEEEIKLLLEQGTEAGTFEQEEQAMVERVLRLDDRRVRQLMTPRPDIVWLNLEDSAEENRHKMTASTHTRFPVCQSVLDNVLGVVQVTDLLSLSLNGQPIDLTACLRQPLYVPESTRALKVLELFKQSGTHIALTVDEYGVIQGLVTLNDILEAIVGDLPSVDEPRDPQITRREDGSWLLDGMLSVEKFRELFDLQELPGEHRGNYHTLGGFIITHLGRIPITADHFDWGTLRFEVMDMDGNRVDKVLVIPIAKEEKSTDLEIGN
jgi:putative hemolysin